MLARALSVNYVKVLRRRHLQPVINTPKVVFPSLKPTVVKELQTLKHHRERALTLSVLPVGPVCSMADARYCVEYAKTGRSGCKKCKQGIDKGVCRIGKVTNNPFSDDGGEMKAWHHTRCIFETFKVSSVYIGVQIRHYNNIYIHFSII